jgi:hypothetical protein
MVTGPRNPSERAFGSRVPNSTSGPKPYRSEAPVSFTRGGGAPKSPRLVGESLPSDIVTASAHRRGEMSRSPSKSHSYESDPPNKRAPEIDSPAPNGPPNRLEPKAAVLQGSKTVLGPTRIFDKSDRGGRRVGPGRSARAQPEAVSGAFKRPGSDEVRSRGRGPSP